MRAIFHPEALNEFYESVRFYESQEPELGVEFAFEVESALERIADFPKLAPQIHLAARRGLVNRFPFGIVYLLLPDRIFVVAVAHLHRDPGYWLDRLP